MALNPEINKQALSAAFNWWLHGLRSAMPGGLLEAFLQPVPRLVANAASGTGPVRFDYVLGDRVEVIDSAEPAELEAGGDFLREALARHGLAPEQLQLDVVVDPETVLRFETSLPLAAESDLLTAVGYQLERLTPFTSNQVYYGAEITRRDTATGRLLVSLLVLPRGEIDPLLQQLERLAGKPAARITTAGLSPSFNFLRIPGVRRKPNRNVALLLGLLLAVSLAVAAPVIKQRAIVVEQTAVVGQLRGEVRDLVAIRGQLQSSLVALGYALDQRAKRPSTVMVLEELSGLVPDTTWLRQLQLKGDQLEIQGEGKGAVDLVNTLEESPLFKEVRFASAVTHDARLDVDRFQIEAVLESP
jgi:general secretion pathway protein L